MRQVVLIGICLLLPGFALAGVVEDFEIGSGGIRLVELDQMVRVFIYAVMCVFVGGVLYSALKDVTEAGAGDYYAVVVRILRSFLLCVVVILTIT